MSKFHRLFQEVHEKVHDLRPKKLYSEPKIYTGGVDIKQWKKLSKEEKESAISRSWYVRWSFRNPETGKLTRQKNIKAGANYYKTKSERIEILTEIQKSLLQILESGYNPYTKRRDLTEIMSVEDAIAFALEIKKGDMSPTSFRKFKSRINGFKSYLLINGFKNRYITSVTKNDAIDYLNGVAKKTSNRNRNNTRIAISSLFSTLYNNEIISENFIKKISVLKAPPKRNKTFSDTVLADLIQYMEKNDSLLLNYIRFISYNFLRPIEVSRLKVGDIDLRSKTLRVFVKQGNYKQKRIPDILFNELGYLVNYDPELLIFTPSQEPDNWETKEEYRRGYMGKRFTKIKNLKEFGLGDEYTLSSFRHYYITKLYRSYRRNMTPFEVKSNLMLVTGHSTMTALEKYLRDIDAEIPGDYSEHL